MLTDTYFLHLEPNYPPHNWRVTHLYAFTAKKLFKKHVQSRNECGQRVKPDLTFSSFEFCQLSLHVLVSHSKMNAESFWSSVFLLNKKKKKNVYSISADVTVPCQKVSFRAGGAFSQCCPINVTFRLERDDCVVLSLINAGSDTPSV